MILSINTIKNNSEEIEISLSDNNKIIAGKTFKAKYEQAEKLLQGIDILLNEAKINFNQIKKIKIENKGGSFTALRIGVITANSLGYALGIRVIGSIQSRNRRKSQEYNIIEPIYSKKPNITKRKK